MMMRSTVTYVEFLVSPILGIRLADISEIHIILIYDDRMEIQRRTKTQKNQIASRTGLSPSNNIISGFERSTSDIMKIFKIYV